ncbi:hypothetical protein [Natrinema salaciae]|uniref:Uncharacterized protein n=1 Tax=Natrinema salaciae TaxID=1186196 RepID=A0A1H9SGE1_9EURY|nr:hypothetical protein [Natrinema salaciae]SER84052.1 hypothetical protein SAMN04489841_4719 [Natrinema salaciae]
MVRDNATADPDNSQFTADAEELIPSPVGTETTATATIAATRTGADDGGALPNTLTIMGQGTPSSFELTVDGEIELADDPQAAVTILSGTAVEGTVASDTVTFRFTGELTAVTFVDRGITGLEPATTPNVHVDYGTPERSQS